MDLTPSHADGRDYVAALLSRQWMRAESFLQTYYPREIQALSDTRGLSWGEEITGKWLCDASALSGDEWPGNKSVTSVAQTVLIFNNSIQAVALGTNSATTCFLVGGSMVDQVGLSRLLQCLGRACAPGQEPGVPDLQQVSRSRGQWRAVIEMSKLCRDRFLRNTTPLTEHDMQQCRFLVSKIESSASKVYFTDLVREVLPSCSDEVVADRIVFEAITTSRAAITGDISAVSYLSNIQATRRVRNGWSGAVVVDDSIEGRRFGEFTPWVGMLSDGTVCILGPNMKWAVRTDHQVCILGNLNNVFAPLTTAQTAELVHCPKGRLWRTELRQISEFTVQTLANLARLVESIPQISQDLREELDDAYAAGCDEFSGRSINAANRALQRLRDQHPTAWETFVSHNMTVRTVLGLYQGTPTADALAGLLTERLVAGISGTNFRVNSDDGSQALVVRGTGAPGQRDICLVRSGAETRSGLSLPELLEGLGVGEGEHKWIYTGLRIVERRFDNVIDGNCLTPLLDKAEAPRPRVVLPVLLDGFPGMLPYTDSAKGDRRTPYWQKKSPEVRPVVKGDVPGPSAEGTEVG